MEGKDQNSELAKGDKGNKQQTLKTKAMMTKIDEFWVLSGAESRVRQLQKSFILKDGDIILASMPKTGTTWLKALVHCIMCPPSSPDRLNDKNPHELMPLMDFQDINEWCDLPSPRLLHTHLPLEALPQLAGTDANVKIVYVTRNPRDTFISMWKQYDALMGGKTQNLVLREMTMKHMFDKFCKGEVHGGPFPQHVIGYMRESVKNPNKVLFLRYEDLLDDCQEWVKKIGVFLGFSGVEAKACEISERCSFKALSGYEPNKPGKVVAINEYVVPSSCFFRVGRSGEWKQYFSPGMEDRIKAEIEQPLMAEGISFNY